MDIVDLVNDFIDKRKSEKPAVHTNNENKSEDITEKTISEPTNKITNMENLEYYIELLNQGVNPSKIEKHFNLAYGSIQTGAYITTVNMGHMLNLG